MPEVLGEDLIIEVEDPDNAGVFVEVENMNNYSRSTTRDVKSTKVFNKTRPIKSPSRVSDDSFTISGITTDDDAGQEILSDAAEAGTPVTLRIRPNGVAGFTQEVLLTSLKDDAQPDDFQTVGYEATAVGEKVAYP